jgi:hypothetical protein
MTAPSLAQLLIIPIAGTLSLTAWLALVFHADCSSWRFGGNPAADEAQEELLAAPADRADLRVVLGVER